MLLCKKIHKTIISKFKYYVKFLLIEKYSAFVAFKYIYFFLQITQPIYFIFKQKKYKKLNLVLKLLFRKFFDKILFKIKLLIISKYENLQIKYDINNAN